MTTKFVRERYGLTQKDLSEKYGISLRTIQNWEYRRSCPRYIVNLIATCEILELRLKER